MEKSNNRNFTRIELKSILEGVKGKLLGDVDVCHIIKDSRPNNKGIAGSVIEQSVLGYKKDNVQGCDISVDGNPTEVKTTGLRVPLNVYKKIKDKKGKAYNICLRAKEPMSITTVTLAPSIELEFKSSHFFEKVSRMLLVYYEYRIYDKKNKAKAADYATFPIVDYQFHNFNQFTPTEQLQLQKDWEIVRDFLQPYYETYENPSERYKKMQNFTGNLRGRLLLIDMAPAFKHKRNKEDIDSIEGYNKPRYRFKQSFLDQIVVRNFCTKSENGEIELDNSFSSFSELDARCEYITRRYGGLTLGHLQKEFNIKSESIGKNIAELCVLHMFKAKCKKLNKIIDFTRAGIIAKTITLTKDGKRTEDMKLFHVNFDEWNNTKITFKHSEIYNYFYEHCFLFPIFQEEDKSDVLKTVFKGFKRLSFDLRFINSAVNQTWCDSRQLVHDKQLRWIYTYNKEGQVRVNKSGSFMGAPNFPKSEDYVVFFRGSQGDSSDKSRTVCINGIRMLPQWIWIKGTYVADRLSKINYLGLK